jgi:SAM-dependent methyltransferase
MPQLNSYEVSTDISAQDGMFEGDRNHYFSVGQSALRCIELAAQAAGRARFHNILDFGCGFGRVLRVLKAAYPEAGLAACDLSREALDFCATAFGAEPFFSNENPDNVVIGRTFDLIWCGTMLTNIDAAPFIRFLQLFKSLLSRDGLLVFTTHGPFVADRIRTGEYSYGVEEASIPAMLTGYVSSGFGYSDYPPEVLARVGVEKYGISISKPSWVCGQIEAIPDLRVMMYTERAWDNHQDCVACSRT